MKDKAIIGESATKMKPDEYYKATGQLLNKTKKAPVKAKQKDNPPKKNPAKQASVLQLAEELQSPQLDEYFKKCASAGMHATTTMNALISEMEPGEARECRASDISTNPYITLATCMLDK